MAHLWRSTTDRARPRSRVVPIAIKIDAGIKTDTSDTPEGADYGYTACAMHDLPGPVSRPCSASQFRVLTAKPCIRE